MNTHDRLLVVEGCTLPQKPDTETVYRLLPNNPDPAYYQERTDRNIGWITTEEQEMLKNMTVGIAGCGGMGGLIASTFVRLGIGEIRVADCEEFDISNINRQFGAMRSTVGVSKAFATARMIREITDDTTLVVYPQGITEETVDHFLDGCDVVCDEIELLVIDARILLHKCARKHGVSLFNCNTVGFSTNLFLYTPKSMTMEEATGLSYDEAVVLRERACNLKDCEAIDKIISAIMGAVVPELPEYSPTEQQLNREYFYHRLFKERRAAIIATNPSMAGGFLANRVLLYLLRNSGVRRKIAETPVMPGYLHFDAAKMEVKINEKIRS